MVLVDIKLYVHFCLHLPQMVIAPFPGLFTVHGDTGCFRALTLVNFTFRFLYFAPFIFIVHMAAVIVNLLGVAYCYEILEEKVLERYSFLGGIRSPILMHHM